MVEAIDSHIASCDGFSYYYTAGNPHKEDSWFCKEIREDNFQFLVEEISRRRFARYVHVKN